MPSLRLNKFFQFLREKTAHPKDHEVRFPQMNLQNHLLPLFGTLGFPQKICCPEKTNLNNRMLGSYLINTQKQKANYETADNT